MKREELIEATKILLENLSTKKNLNNEIIPIDERVKLNSLLRALNKLQIQDQYIIAYKYFEGKKVSEIVNLLNINRQALTKRLNELYLEIGRLVYGFEEEFKNIIEGKGEEHKNIIADIIEEVTKKVFVGLEEEGAI